MKAHALHQPPPHHLFFPKPLALVVGLIWLAGFHAFSQVLVSNVADTNVPTTDVLVNQNNSSGTIFQARYAATNRGVSQTFLWNSTAALDGIGLRMGSSTTVFPDDMTWILDVQEINPTTNAVISSATHLAFTLPAAAVVRNSYLYLDFTSNLTLTNGSSYGFYLYPDTSVTGLATHTLFFNSAANTAYTGGVGDQKSTMTSLTNYSSTNNFDLTFYLTTAAVPEPQTWMSLAFGLAVLVLVRRRRK